MSLTLGSMYSGIGGMDLGLERAGMRVVWQAEIDPYGSRVLARHWPNVRNLGDVCAVNWSEVERPDVLAGGFMCTDLSVAGEMKGLEGDTRSGITWRELVRAVRALRPDYVLVENVPSLLSGDDGRWFGTVLGELAACGYDAEWDVLSACTFGAPHTRERVFVVAYPHTFDGKTGMGPLSLGARTLRDACGGARESLRRRTWLEAVSRVSGSAHGVSGAMDRSAGLGNAVVPDVAEYLGRLILNHAAGR